MKSHFSLRDIREAIVFVRRGGFNTHQKVPVRKFRGSGAMGEIDAMGVTEYIYSTFSTAGGHGHNHVSAPGMLITAATTPLWLGDFFH